MARIVSGIISIAFVETGDKSSIELHGGNRSEGFDLSYSQPGGNKPEREVTNYELNSKHNLVIDIQKHGILEWSNKIDFEHPVIVFGSNNKLYLSKRNSGVLINNIQDPVSDTNKLYWQPIFDVITSFTENQIPNFDASKVTSGVLVLARIPGLNVSIRNFFRKSNSGYFSR